MMLFNIWCFDVFCSIPKYTARNLSLRSLCVLQTTPRLPQDFFREWHVAV